MSLALPGFNWKTAVDGGGDAMLLDSSSQQPSKGVEESAAVATVNGGRCE